MKSRLKNLKLSTDADCYRNRMSSHGFVFSFCFFRKFYAFNRDYSGIKSVLRLFSAAFLHAGHWVNKLLIFTVIVVCGSGAGYKGSLPDINAQFESKRQSEGQLTKPIFNTSGIQNNNPNFKKAPRENPQYIDIILKKDKTSPYINDLNDVIVILEKMKKCIDNNGNVQKFNAIASSIIDHADFMAQKYANKPEQYYISFVKLQNIAAEARSLATLRCESQVYIKYLTYQGEGQVYSKDSINRQIELFREQLDITIRILKDAT